MADAQKIIQDLRSLVSVVVANTKRESEGRNGKPTLERQSVKKVLTHLLGREPAAAEVEAALAA